MERSPPIPLHTLVLAAALGLALAACSASTPEPDAGSAAGSTSAAAAVTDADIGGDGSGPAGPASADPDGNAPPDQQAVCSVEPVQSLVGQQADEALVAQATALSRSTSVRVLKPGDAATMDYRGDRLNILTDEAGVVQSFNCG